MMQELLIILAVDAALLVFFAAGYYVGHSHKSTVEKKPLLPPETKKHSLGTSGGVIEYPSQEEVDYTKSGEEAVDKKRTELFEKYFKP